MHIDVFTSSENGTINIVLSIVVARDLHLEQLYKKTHFIEILRERSM